MKCNIATIADVDWPPGYNPKTRCVCQCELCTLGGMSHQHWPLEANALLLIGSLALICFNVQSPICSNVHASIGMICSYLHNRPVGEIVTRR